MRKLAFVATAATLALGSGAAEKSPKESGQAAPTYAKEVSRIVRKNCEGCHRPGQIGPFALTNYDEVSAFAPEIKKVTAERRMPPWFAVKGFGEFKNDRRLSDADIETLARWVDAGAPKGDVKDLPAPVAYNDEWALGTPDAVLAPDVAYPVEASGVDEYRCFVVPTDFGEDRNIQAMEIRPGSRKVVHHVLLYADTSGKARQRDAADPKPGYSCWGSTLGFSPSTSLGGWAPGGVPGKLPDDMAHFLPAGADIVMQVHYHKNGTAEMDRTSLGLHFNRHPVTKYIRSQPVLNLGIRIPPGEENHRETAKWILNRDLLAISVAPHMHLLGKEMQMTATFPDGAKKDLVWVKPYHFNWQTSYVFKEPILLPKGTRVDVTAYYDNSEKNPNNPNNPLKEARWGDATTDEMLIGWVAYVTDSPPQRTLPDKKPAASATDGR